MLIEYGLLGAQFADVRRVYIARARIESGRIADARTWMLENGFEVLDLPDDQLLTADGREVLRAHGKAWALKPEVHTKRLADAIAQAKHRDASKEAQSQRTQNACTALIDGQLCGGSFTVSPVCPRCALGKQGVTATLTCDVCGHVTAIMRGENV